MKSLKSIIFIIFVLLLLGWVGIIFIDYQNAAKEKSPKFCLKKEIKEYNDGTTTSCTGLGYKIYIYDRADIKAHEFGTIFLKEKNIEDLKEEANKE